MVFKDPFNCNVNFNGLRGIPQQVAYHPDVAGMWQLNKYSYVRSMRLKGSVSRMPDALPTENAASRFDFRPLRVEGVASMTKPLRTELPCLTVGASLDEQPPFTKARPVRRRQVIGLRHGNWQTCRKTTRSPIHNIASEPRRRLLAGVTMGPPITIATSFRFTWLVEVPRT